MWWTLPPFLSSENNVLLQATFITQHKVWPVVLTSQSTPVMLRHQHVDTSHLSGRWIISAKRSSVTRVLTHVLKIWTKQKLSENGCRNKTVVFLFSLRQCCCALKMSSLTSSKPETREQIILRPELKLQLLIQSVIYCYLSFFHTYTRKICQIILRSIKNNQFLNTDRCFHQEHLLSINMFTGLLQFSSE